MNQDQSSNTGGTPAPVLPGGLPVKPKAFRPYLTYSLIAVCVLVYLLQVATLYLFKVDIPAAIGVKDNSLILQGQVWRLITPIFLHSDQTVLHILFNMYALFYIGRTLERFYGRARYLGLFLLGGFAGNVISFMFSSSDSLGSSTSIFGLLGAYGVLIYQNREVFGPVARAALSQVIIIAVINLIIGLTPGSDIDNWGHIGGLIGGTLFAWFGGPVLRKMGMTPPFPVANTRTERETLIAGVGVGFLFFFLTVVAFFVRRG